MAVDYSQGKIREIQRLLNVIRDKAPSATWGSIRVDGIWGPETLSALRKFQGYAHLSVDGIPGPQTWGALQNYSSATSFLSSARPGYTLAQPSLSPNDNTSFSKKGLSIVNAVSDVMIGFMGNLSDVVSEMAKGIRDYGKADPNALKNSYVHFTARWDSRMKDLRKAVQGFIQSGDNIAKNEKAMASAKYLHANNVNRRLRQAEVLQKHYGKVKLNKCNEIIREIKKYDFVSKIDKYLKNKGFSGEIKLDKLGTAFKGKNIKVSTGGTALLVFSLKDILWDLVQINKWGTDQWWQDLKKDLYEFFDGLVMAFAAAVIAQIIAGAIASIAAICGVTISAGWIVVIVAALTILIASVLMYLLQEADVSFTETAVQGYQELFRSFF